MFTTPRGVQGKTAGHHRFDAAVPSLAFAAAADAGKPIAAINLGRTRADDLMALRIIERCSTALRAAVS